MVRFRNVNLTQRLRSWTYSRQRLGRTGDGPLEALADIIAVYSTHPSAPLTLLPRCASLTPDGFRSMEQQREVVRITAMRGSSFMVPTRSAAKILAVTRISPARLASRMQYGGLDPEAYDRLAPKVLECCAQPVTPGEIRRCAGSTDPSQDVYFLARMLAREGRILRIGGSLRTDQLKYVATQAWLGNPFEAVDPTSALEWLAGEYLRAFGPARVVDFAWWAGVPRRSAQAALGALETVELDGLLMLATDRDAFGAVEPLDSAAVAVLPKWDSYTMAYAPDGRQRLVDDAFLGRAYTSVEGSPGATAGDGLPLVLRSGRAVASWSHRFDGQRLSVTVDPFEPGHLPDSAFDAVGQLLSASTIDVTTART
jgi:hypothetical protein